MTDYPEAALREATVRCSDTSDWCVTYVPAGQDGCLVPGFRAFAYPASGRAGGVRAPAHRRWGAGLTCEPA